jgi:hypothetical protein
LKLHKIVGIPNREAPFYGGPSDVPNVIEFPAKSGHGDIRSPCRLRVYRLLAEMLHAEAEGEFWKADALFVQLGRTTGRSGMLDKGKANAAVAAARICSMVARNR